MSARRSLLPPLLPAALTALAVFAAFAAPPGTADGVRFEVVYAAGDKFTITERSDLRRYEDSRFVGLSSREVKGVLDVREEPGGSRASGSFYVYEATRRDTRLVAKLIDDVIPVSFVVRSDGAYEVAAEQAYPALRSFPTFPPQPLKPGDRWQAWATRVVEPFRDGKYTRARVFVGYEYQGPAVWEGRAMELVTAHYAFRYRGGDDLLGDTRIRAISGTHSAKIYFDAAQRRPAFVETQVDELYSFDGQKSVGYKGFILTWYRGVTPMDRGRIAEDVRTALGPQLTGGGAPPAGLLSSALPPILGPGVTVRETDEGLTLELSDIRFVADQAVVLPEERPRLEAVARALKKVPGRNFLVIGHTARAGTMAGQKALSVERAKAVVDFLVASGLEASRFSYEGRGASEPIASNDTLEGMALNRRVEIVVLEE